MGRVLGRIAEVERDGLIDCQGWLAVIRLYDEGSFAGVAWVDPAKVITVYAEPPARLLAWITGPDWVRTHADIARIIAMSQHGTLAEQFIDSRDNPDKPYNSRPEYAAQWILP